MRLGYSGIGDYARERLGMAGRTAQAMARLARELRDRPLLRAAVQRGEVSSRKAEVVLPMARGEAEEQWVALARVETVRALRAAVGKALATGEADEDQEWERICVPLAPEGRAKLDQAMELAGKVLGATAPKWQRLEAICQEYLGAHPSAEPGEDTLGVGVVEGGWDALGAGGAVIHSPPSAAATGRAGACPSSEDLRELLETETDRWAWLGVVQPVEAPSHAADGDHDPFQLDEELRGLVSMRERWDELVGHLGMLLRMLGLWRELGFASFSHYCTERLGMGSRTVEQRAWLERRFHALPALRRAMRQGRLSYEKARLVAGCADDITVKDWIERAEKVTCIALRREIESLACSPPPSERFVRLKGAGSHPENASSGWPSISSRSGIWRCVSAAPLRREFWSAITAAARCRVAAGRLYTRTMCSIGLWAAGIRGRTWSVSVLRIIFSAYIEDG